MTEKEVGDIIKDSKKEGGIVIMRCHCVSVFQDQHYGLSMRVHNRMANKTKGKARCTVCGDVKT